MKMIIFNKIKCTSLWEQRGGKSLSKKGIFVHPTAIVKDGTEIGDGTENWHHVHVRRGAKLGKNRVLRKGGID